ncbi:MAG: hypothetical protein K1X75_04205 [Leptospirales bacterium]|nr:hypothetical protein [Leptospirales bacterium]
MEEQIPPLGLSVQRGDNGDLILRATARASSEAIDSGSLARKQVSACEAARVLLERELRSEQYHSVRQNFAVGGVFLLQANEYCSIVGLYNPSGVVQTRQTAGPPVQLDLQ